MTISREWIRGAWVERESLTVAEARSVLDAWPEHVLVGRSKVNPGLTRVHAMGIFRKCIDGKADADVLTYLMAKNIQREFGKKAKP